MPVASVSSDYMIVFSAQPDGSGSNRLLTNVEVKKTSHHPLVVKFECRLLKAADTRHIPEKINLVSRCQDLIDLGLGEVERGGR